MWKMLFAILPILCMVSFSLPVSSQAVEKKVCQTKECLSAAQNLKNSINFDVNPCDDFYKYACGNWPKHHNNSDSETQSVITLRVEENKAELSDHCKFNAVILRGTIRCLDFLKQNNSDKEPIAVHKARKFLSTCLNDVGFRNNTEKIETTLQKIGLSSISLLSNETGNFDYSTALAKASRLAGIYLFFELNVEPNYVNNVSLDDSAVNVITLGKPAQSRIIYQDVHDYVNKITQKVCGDNTSTFCVQLLSSLNSTMDTIKEKITNYTDGMNKVIRGRSSSAQNYTLKELQNWTDEIVTEVNATIPKLNWTRYFEEMFSDLNNVTLNLNDPTTIEIFIEGGKNVITDMLRFIHTSQNTKIIELALWWKSLGTLLPNFDVFESFDRSTNRQQSCEKLTTRLFSMASSYVYATKDKYVEAKTEITSMVQHIRESFQQLINESAWMGEKTKERALNKLQMMGSQIVYPTVVTTTSILNDRYKDVQLSDSFYDMLISTLQNSITQKLNTLNQVYDPNRSIKKPTIVNALYYPPENAMVIPAAIVGTQSIYYYNNLRALSYGGIGSIVGHEITHGFDNNGRFYNEFGKKEDWWDAETARMYIEKASCFVDAYGNYKTNYTGLEQLEKNMTKTLGEDISDNTGFKESLLAYRKCIAITGEEPLLPQFENFTHEQLLTLAFGNLWCGNKQASAGNRYDPHSPSVIRVNGVFRNSKEFAEIWNCPKGSNMNPNTEKCSLW